jgi:hypothetical protein
LGSNDPPRESPELAADWATWVALRAARYHGARPQRAPGDTRVLGTVRRLCDEHAEDDRARADRLVVGLLTAYLDDQGTGGYLAGHAHPLRLLDRNGNENGYLAAALRGERARARRLEPATGPRAERAVPETLAPAESRKAAAEAYATLRAALAQSGSTPRPNVAPPARPADVPCAPSSLAPAPVLPARPAAPATSPLARTETQDPEARALAARRAKAARDKARLVALVVHDDARTRPTEAVETLRTTKKKATPFALREALKVDLGHLTNGSDHAAIEGRDAARRARSGGLPL